MPHIAPSLGHHTGTVLLALCCACLCSATNTAATNNAPIIGILSVPIQDQQCITALDDPSKAPGGGSCFHSLYTKFVESAGARVVPIRYDASDAELRRLFRSVNGVLFTGGEVDIKHQADDASAQYMHAASLLYNATLAAHDGGEYVPLWGTCMGVQTLAILGAGSGDVLSSGSFDSEDESLALDLAPAAAASRMFGNSFPTAAPADTVLKWLTTENVTSNLHHDGLEPAVFAASAAAAVFDVLATDLDRKGKPFIAVLESKSYPVYGTQYHPERPMFEWAGGELGIDHGAHAVAASQWHANFLVAEARKNSHRFDSAKEEQAALIYNYQPTGTTSYQAYHFEPAADDAKLPRPQHGHRL